jgi:hypothetical protein
MRPKITITIILLMLAIIGAAIVQFVVMGSGPS